MTYPGNKRVRKEYLRKVDEVRRASCMNRVFTVLLALMIIIPILIKIFGGE